MKENGKASRPAQNTTAAAAAKYKAVVTVMSRSSRIAKVDSVEKS